jgi:DNA-binding Xre family transcriptional regulator
MMVGALHASLITGGPGYSIGGTMLKLAVREVAERAGISSARNLSVKTELPYESCRRLWQGTASMVSLATLERLCLVLQVRPAQLFDYDPDVPESRDDPKGKRKG